MWYIKREDGKYLGYYKNWLPDTSGARTLLHKEHANIVLSCLDDPDNCRLIDPWDEYVIEDVMTS